MEGGGPAMLHARLFEQATRSLLLSKSLNRRLDPDIDVDCNRSLQNEVDKEGGFYEKGRSECFQNNGRRLDGKVYLFVRDGAYGKDNSEGIRSLEREDDEFGVVLQ